LPVSARAGADHWITGFVESDLRDFASVRTLVERFRVRA
jgi:hypothetical protein